MVLDSFAMALWSEFRGLDSQVPAAQRVRFGRLYEKHGPPFCASLRGRAARLSESAASGRDTVCGSGRASTCRKRSGRHGRASAVDEVEQLLLWVIWSNPPRTTRAVLTLQPRTIISGSKEYV